MTYQPPTLSIVTSTLRSKMASIHRRYTGHLKLYRSHQASLAYGAPKVGYSAADLETRAAYLQVKVDYYREAVRSLSYQYRAYKRAVELLEAEELLVRPTGMTGPQLTEAAQVAHSVLSSYPAAPDQQAGQIAYQLSRRGFHK